MRIEWILALLLACAVAHGQWIVQPSGTQADLRGIISVSDRVAWASGSQGTVLRTNTGGQLWKQCPVPPGADKLDFRAVQAADDRIAWVMSAGAGDLSRVYATTDGCRTWKLLLTNPDRDGFWDALTYQRNTHKLFLLGDPVGEQFALLESGTDAAHWSKMRGAWQAAKGQAAFAASNSILLAQGDLAFVTGGTHSELVRARSRTSLPFAPGDSSGAFSLAFDGASTFVVVGGDYTKPDDRSRTAAFSVDGGHHFAPAAAMPNGYRSAVSYYPAANVWIAVGPNGTDVSHDRGRRWDRLSQATGLPYTGAGWNALSLPFAVGPKGRVGRLRNAVALRSIQSSERSDRLRTTEFPSRSKMSLSPAYSGSPQN